MFILYIEHSVPSYEGWKKAFESDPLKRKESGVKSYRIMNDYDKKEIVIIELAFDNLANAAKMAEKLNGLWKHIEGTVMINPVSRILELKEENTF